MFLDARREAAVVPRRAPEAAGHQMETQVSELTERCKLIKEREEERRKADAAKHEEEVAKYKKINEQLKSNLEAMLSAPQRS